MAGDPNVKVKFDVEGLEKVRNGMRIVGGEAESTTRKWGTASRQIAGGLEAVARQGKMTGEAMKAIVTQGAEMAFMFGAGGPIVGALAITGVAIYEHIVGGMRKAREEAVRFQEQIAGMRRSGNLGGAADIAQSLYSGDRYAVQGVDESERDYKARQGGILGIRANIAGLRDVEQTGATAGVRLRAYNEIQALNKILAEYTKRHQQATAAVAELSAAEGARLSNIARIEAEGFYGGNQVPGVSVGSPVPGAPSMMKTSGFGAAMNSLPIGKLVGIGKAQPADNPATKAIVDGMAAVGEMAGTAFADTLADTIEAGITRAFQKGANIGGIFSAIAETALAGLGSIATRIGRAALVQFTFIDKIAKGIAGLNPAIGIPAALGLIAFGAAMGGAGHRIGANAGGFGGGGGGGAYGASSGYGASIIDRGIIDPNRTITARSGNNYSFTVIGANDPKVQSDILKLIDNAERRGSV